MRRQTRTVAELHDDWLSQVDVDGPFLALPVIKDIWPDGVERLGDADDRMTTFKQAFVTWQRELDALALADRTPEATQRYAEVTRAWIDTVLDLAGWAESRVGASEIPSSHEIRSPGEQITVRPTDALRGRDHDHAALLLVVEPTDGLREVGLDGWAATDVDRMAMLLRNAGVETGVVTDGRWWAIVWAADGKPTGSGMVDAFTWGEEPLLRDAFLTLIDRRRFRAKQPEERLPHLFARSELEAEVITEALGTQVRRSVELLVQSFSEARLAAARFGDPDPLTDDADEVYQAAVTVMMRVVFLLFAEERDMLPTEQIYWDSYAVRDLLTELREQAAHGEEPLDESFDAWHRLLAVSQALFAGVNYDEMRMPAYGGSLLDPDRFPWLAATDHRGRLRLQVSDRVLMHVLESVQTVVVKGERRRVSFRDIDVEQIGYIYEGLLGYSCAIVEDQAVLGLIGKTGEEPEIDADTLQELYDDTTDGKSFAAAVREWVKVNQPASTPPTAAQLAKLYDAELSDDEEAHARRVLTPIAGNDSDLLDFLVDWSKVIRRDLRGIPLVIPVGGLVVVETPSRKNAGAHYTPRSLAEEVVLHALQPLVYEPGPLQTSDKSAWRLKSSSAILDLKVADIAAGSGAFLVAAARYLADRVAEAWTDEDRLEPDQVVNPHTVRDRAIREVVARCLYGADINPMAVEMCKLSLWLVSMDKTKPFSFVDDKIFCGNSLLGISDLNQLRYVHIHPDPKIMDAQILVDIDGRIAEAARLRSELASPVEAKDPMRSSRGKTALLRSLNQLTADLRLAADAVLATALSSGGGSGRRADADFAALSSDLSRAFSPDGVPGDVSSLDRRLRAGLVPTVKTDYQRWFPVHWVIEAPDVMLGPRQGFDAVIGNPPFLGDKKLRGALGDNVREYLSRVVGRNARGGADLVAYFLLSAESLVGRSGTFGLIATNSATQGDTRKVGLDQVLRRGFALIRAQSSRPWPSQSANLEYVAIWGARVEDGSRPLAFLDGDEVPGVSSLLEPVGGVEGDPLPLKENANRAFVGSYVLGGGFVLDRDEYLALKANDPNSAEVLWPYLNGSDLNGSPSMAPSRFVINFLDWPKEEAENFRGAFSRVERLVRPERAKVARKANRERWWQYAETRPGLRRALRPLTNVIVIAQVSKTLMPVRVPTGPVFDSKLIVFPTGGFDQLAVLSSSFHRLWCLKYGTTMRQDATYTPRTCFEPFPRPSYDKRLSEAGELLHVERSEIMQRRGMGLTRLYNLVNDSAIQGDLDVGRVRDLHVEVDRAVADAYGFEKNLLQFGFHRYRQVERWTVASSCRIEMLDLLLALNHERARAEGRGVPEQTGHI